MSSSIFKLPMSLYPTAAQDRISEGMLADIFAIDVREIRAMMSWTRDLLVSRAIEGNYITRDWSPRRYNLAGALDELSHAICGHWSKLLSPAEREERRHVQFVLRVMRRQYQPEVRKSNHVV